MTDLDLLRQLLDATDGYLTHGFERSGPYLRRLSDAMVAARERIVELDEHTEIVRPQHDDWLCPSCGDHAPRGHRCANCINAEDRK